MGCTRKMLNGNRVVPVVVINDKEDVLPIAESLLKGGVSIIEITLRSECALSAIETVAKELPEMTVGAGTVLSPKQYELAVNAGSKFIVSPGLSDELAIESKKYDVPFLPGVATPSEIIKASEIYGFTFLKLFPAEVFGGLKALNAYKSVFQNVCFCPTGGVAASNYLEYLAMENVACVGGSWLVPNDAIKDKDWELIYKMAKSVARNI